MIINSLIQNTKSKIQNLISHTGFRKYFTNTSWLFAEKILRMAIGFFVGVWVARYLGPERFGLLSYVTSFVSLFIPLGKLGFDGIVSRNIARGDSDIDELLSTTILFKFMGSFVVVVIASSYMYFTKKDNIYFYLALILSFSFVIKSFEVLEFYFRAKVKAKYISIANSIALLFSSFLKVIFIMSKFTLIYFALANFVEAIVFVFFLYIYFKNESQMINFFKVNFIRGLELLQESWPLIFSGFFALIYLNIDQVMLQELRGNYDVGQYSAAVRISSMWYFIPLTITWSVQPAIVKAKQQSKKIYYERLQLLFTLMAIIAYVIIIPVALFSNHIVEIFFGKVYSLAGKVLTIHIMALLFVFVGIARGLWVTNESYFKFALFSNVGAGVLNVILNLFWIPKYGIMGAAWATLISYIFTYVLSGFFFPPAKKIAIMQIKSILLLDIFNQYRRFKEYF